MIAIVDYEAGNILSVENALRRLGAAFEVTADPARLRAASHVILPGVGEASSAIARLNRPLPGGETLAGIVRSLDVPVLGICIGVQLLCRSSEEGGADCLGVFSPRVRRFPAGAGAKIPHMGWNAVEGLSGPLFRGIPEGTFVYYVHSYYPEYAPGETVAVTEYAGCRFSAALQRGHFFGTQFHPEKSGPAGAVILKNFLSL